jgi:parallel beta-helix repeat protein
VSFQPVKSQFLGSVHINPDGSVTGTSNIQRNGNLYTLTGNISGGIQVQKSGIIIDGAGYAVQGNGTGRGIDLSNGHGEDPSRTPSSNVTVRNLRIVNFAPGIDNRQSNNNTFYGNYIANCDPGIWVGGSGHTIMYNTIEDNVNGISITYAGGNNIIYKNNMINSDIMVWLSPQPTVDRNYWSDYTTKYPNAKEIGNTGIWDTPYDYGGSGGTLLDYHPLVNPVNISDFEIPPIPEVPDTTSPAISVISPENKTYSVNNVSLTFAVSESTSWICYSLDGQANVTITKNETMTGLSVGSHSITMYAKDVAGNVGASETIHFTIAQEAEPQPHSPSEPFPIIWVAFAIAIGIAVILGVALCRRRLKSTQNL